MTRVLQIANYKPGTGGISGQVEKIHAYLDKEHVDNAVISVKGSIWYRISAVFRLMKTGKEYDVFHIHSCSYGGFLSAVMGITVGKMLKKRIVLTYHGGGGEAFFEKHSRFVRFFLMRTDANIVLSGFLGKVFDAYKIPYQEIPNVIEIDASRFKQREMIKPNYISVRSLEPLYNIECIIKAFGKVKSVLPQATLLVVGGGSQRANLEKLVADNQIADVTFTGRVDNLQIYDCLDRADVMLSSPRVDNMPVSLLEAFCAGLLVISSKVGGVPYMIEDGVNGILFESDDSDELAEKMIAVVEDQEKSKQIIGNARNRLAYYSWENVRTKLLPLYGMELS